MVQSVQSGLLTVICGPSGVGKSTIATRLRDTLHLEYIVSATTREMRPGDEDAKTYDYISAAEFFRRLDGDEFLEYAQVHGHYYGTPKHPALDYLAEGRDVLLEIDVQGALQVRYHYPQAVLILIEPPDVPTLLKRLEKRARDSQDDILRRFRAARREIHMAKGSRAFDYSVINDEVDRAVEEFTKIVKHKRAGGL